MATVRTSSGTWTTAAGNKTVTLTPGLNDLVVVLCGNSGTTVAPTVTDDNQSGTYTVVDGMLSNASANKGWAAIRNSLIPAPVSTIFTFVPGAVDTGGGLVVAIITGIQKVGSAASRQTAKQENQVAGTPAPVFGSAPLAANLCLGWVMDVTNGSVNCVPPAGWTEIADVGYNTPATGCEACGRGSGETNTTITFGGATPSAFGVLVIELDVTTLSFVPPRKDNLYLSSRDSDPWSMDGWR
jgi:hypothetical protein